MSVCEHKKWFKDKKSAKRYAKQLKLMGMGDQNEYRCPICDGYHLTTMDKKKHRAMKRNGEHGKPKTI
jgi:hypothetical protein